MNIISKGEFLHLLNVRSPFSGYVEGIGIVLNKQVTYKTSTLDYACTDSGITRGTTFYKIENIPGIIPLIPIDKPKIIHEALEESLREVVRKINQPGFTPSTKEWVNKLLDEVKRKMESNNESIKKKNAKVTIENKESKKQKLLKDISNLEEKNRALQEVIDEINILSVSNQIYHIMSSNELNTLDEIRAGVRFNRGTGIFEIIIPDKSQLHLVAHELKHAFQFETGTYSSDIENRLFLYDVYDEYEAYQRGTLFGGRGKSLNQISSEKTYQSLPKDNRNIHNNPAIQAILSSIMTTAQKEAELQKIADRTRSAFRVNGKTYTPNRR